ncbi:MAG: alpha/beta family hydrolase [Planctomycetaceae bacterium]
MTNFLTNGPSKSNCTVILAHGAGAAMDTPFMDAFAEGIADAGYRVVRFEFPYMAERRTTGKKKAPNTAKRLIESWREVVDSVEAENTVIGGKSMGGRIASLIADDVGAAGLICLGYPFHPVGKPEKLRTEHLAEIQIPTLIIQGERDNFGKRDEVADYTLSPNIQLEWITDGDHSFKPRKSSGLTQEENWATGISAVVGFLSATL